MYQTDVPSISKTLADFLIDTTLASGIYHLDCGWPMPLRVFIKNKGVPATFISFAATQERGERQPPFFSGAHIAEQLGPNIVLFSDPILELSPTLRLGWYLGSDQIRTQEVIPQVLAHIYQIMGNHAVLWGASGGGFAALYYGIISGARHIVTANPQITVERYGEPSVMAYAKAAFGVVGWKDKILAMKKHLCTDIREIWYKDAPAITYMQNVNDPHHIEWHMTPFLDHAKIPYRPNQPYGEKFTLLMDDWGAGHSRPSKKLIRAELGKAMPEYMRQPQPAEITA
jgi:hypothetical protein